METKEIETGPEQETESKPKGTATENDVARIAMHPQDFGLEWDGSWDAASDTDKDGKRFGSRLVLREKVSALPKLIPTQEAITKFAEAFGWEALAKAYNGTSGRVDAQGVIRAMLLAEWGKDRARSVTTNMLRQEVAKRVLLGIRAKGGGGGGTKYVTTDGQTFKTAEDAAKHQATLTPKTFRGLDGKEYPTGLEAKQASVAFLVETQGMAPAMAATIVANMPE